MFLVRIDLAKRRCFPWLDLQGGASDLRLDSNGRIPFDGLLWNRVGWACINRAGQEQTNTRKEQGGKRERPNTRAASKRARACASATHLPDANDKRRHGAKRAGERPGAASRRAGWVVPADENR
jgi:hypothetical protein